MRYLTVALTKGRLAQKTLDMFEKIGITCEEIRDKNSRKLIFVNEDLKLKFFPCKRTGRSHLCGIRSRRYRSHREGYHHGRRTQAL